MTYETKNTIKRYAVSSVVSFMAAFSLVMVTEIDNISLETIKDGSFVGVIFLAVRAGLKGVLELFVIKRK